MVKAERLEISIKDAQGVDLWLSKARECIDRSVIWIQSDEKYNPKGNVFGFAEYSALGKSTVVDYLKGKGIPDDKVVVTDSSNKIPLQPNGNYGLR